MSHPPPDDETPMQRALRLKKAALDARTRGPAKGQRKPETGVAAGASKPWMKR